MKGTNKFKGVTTKEIMEAFRGTSGFTIDQDIVDWFSDNYIEPEADIRHIIEEACKNHAATPERLQQACVKLRGNKEDNTPLKAHVELLSALLDAGIKASAAGESLRNAIYKIGAFDLLYRKTTKDMGKALSTTINILNKRL